MQVESLTRTSSTLQLAADALHRRPAAAAPLLRRQLLLGAAVLVLPSSRAAAEPALQEATFAGGEPLFLEDAFNQLSYAGVKRVTPGTLGGLRCVRVVYDAAKIGFPRLLGEFWRSVKPTQAGGQFDRRGEEFSAAVFVDNDEERALVESQRGQLERSGVYGAGQALTGVRVIDVSSAGAFEAAPEEERGLGRRDPKKLAELKRRSGRTAYLDSVWGLTTFCRDRVCGYVQFAKACDGECLDVFPQYRNQPGTFAS